MRCVDALKPFFRKEFIRLYMHPHAARIFECLLSAHSAASLPFLRARWHGMGSRHYPQQCVQRGDLVSVDLSNITPFRGRLHVHRKISMKMRSKNPGSMPCRAYCRLFKLFCTRCSRHNFIVWAVCRVGLRACSTPRHIRIVQCWPNDKHPERIWFCTAGQRSLALRECQVQNI